MPKRKDAKFLPVEDPFHSIVPYVMPKRSEAEVSMTSEFDVTELIKYMKEKNENEGTNLKLFHAICAAYAKTIYHRPKLNIFVAGRRFWQRNDITLSFVCKQKFEDEAVETLMFLKVKEDMDLDYISKLILGDIRKARTSGSNDLDKTMEFVGKLPRFILEILFWFIKKFEYYGCMPQSLSAGDPNYSTCILSNLGSIKSDSCYHHLSDYGTCSMVCTIGTLVHDEQKDTYTVPMTVTLDERIADGFYFARSLKLAKYLLAHPEELEKPIKEGVPEEKWYK